MEFFQNDILDRIVDSDKFNVIVIFSLKFWLKFWLENCDLLYAVDDFYQVNILLAPLIGFLYYLLLYQQYVLLMATVYCSLCVVDDNLCKLNN